MRLYRRHIPWSVREQVIDRQMAEAGRKPTWVADRDRSVIKRVRWKLEEFFAGRAVELHHRPALVNRPVVRATGRVSEMTWLNSFGVRVRYEPDANDPDYLVYLIAGAGEEHDVETRVRGQRGQHSDLALARKRRRKERKAKRPKRKWPKRKMRGRR